MLRWCRSCVRDEATRNGSARLYAVPANGLHVVVAVCDEHAQALADAVPASLDDLTGLLELDVAWARPEAAEQLRSRIERRWATPQTTGPLCIERKVRQLRMGQVGFVAVSAVRLDVAGRLWVRRDAGAPQRPHGEHVVPLKRVVDLRLELVGTTEDVARFDARLARPRPAVAGVGEEAIPVIGGLRHLPLLAAVVAR